MGMRYEERRKYKRCHDPLLPPFSLSLLILPLPSGANILSHNYKHHEVDEKHITDIKKKKKMYNFLKKIIFPAFSFAPLQFLLNV